MLRRDSPCSHKMVIQLMSKHQDIETENTLFAQNDGSLQTHFKTDI